MLRKHYIFTLLNLAFNSADSLFMRKIFTSLLSAACLVLFSCASTATVAQECNDVAQSQVIEAPEVLVEKPAEEQPKPLEQKYTLRTVEEGPVYFKETWGYVSQRSPSDYNPSMPITDVCYFAARIDYDGELCSVPSRSSINTGKNRCHLVIYCDSRALTHFIVTPKYEVRRKLLNQIVAASARYDGVQIDFEYVSAKNSKDFITFIADLRYKLKGKMLSVCVPARFELLTNDVYPYAKIANYCDRVFVMAYDQHWSTSKPGAIAEVEWCRKILTYAQSSVIQRKLVMGLPFYARTWGDEPVNNAWAFSGANRIMREHEVENVEYENDIPCFEYTTNVTVKGYFNDAYSLTNMCRMYEQAGVKNVGFWRIGQEDTLFWDYLKTTKK